LPTFAPAITAVVSPAKTRTNVPNNSAAYFIRLSPRENFVPQLSIHRLQGRVPIAAIHSSVGISAEFYMA
jgi:hypothetical protein